MNESNTSKPLASYVAVKPKDVNAFATLVCQELALNPTQLTTEAIDTGLTSFITFVSETLAKYASKGHTDLIHTQKFHKKGVHNGTEKITCTS